MDSEVRGNKLWRKIGEKFENIIAFNAMRLKYETSARIYKNGRRELAKYYVYIKSHHGQQEYETSTIPHCLENRCITGCEFFSLSHPQRFTPQKNY
jgi:hypothetical protein